MSRHRVIHFERIDPEDGPIGFFLGYHNCHGFTPEEDEEFAELMSEVYGPGLPLHGEFCFYWTRHGFHRHKKLIRYLLRVSTVPVRVTRAWKEKLFVAYEDAVQVGARIREKPNRRQRLVRRLGIEEYNRQRRQNKWLQKKS